MKFNWIFLLFAISQPARAMIVISYDEYFEMAKVIRKTLIDQFYIPEQVIQLEWKKPACQKENQTLLHLCLDEQGEIRLVHFNEKQFLQSFGRLLKKAPGMQNNEIQYE